jgi:hypothetical protein
LIFDSKGEDVSSFLVFEPEARMHDGSFYHHFLTFSWRESRAKSTQNCQSERSEGFVTRQIEENKNLLKCKASLSSLQETTEFTTIFFALASHVPLHPFILLLKFYRITENLLSFLLQLKTIHFFESLFL